MGANYLHDALVMRLAEAPARPFIHLPQDGDISAAAFLEGAAQIAGALVAEGLEPGDRLAMQVEKSPRALQLYIATVMAGGIFLPLNTAYTAAEVGYFLADATPRILVCDPSRLEALAPCAGEAGVSRLLTLDAKGSGSLARAAANRPRVFEPAARGPEDLAAILYTSGTTGRAKGAMLSHRALLSNSETLRDAWAFGADDVLIHALPIFHTHGLFVATNVALLSGCRLIFLPGFDADAIVAALPQATALMGVPTFYTRLLDHPGLTRAACAGMRLFVSGSAPLLAATHAAFAERTGHAILERYGMTETNMNTSNPYDGARRPGTVGLPLPGVEVRVTDRDTGAPLPDGSPGMIEVRGPNLFSGYWNMPEKTAEDMREDGFFITGDIGVVEPDGYLSIVGRAKDLIIAGGYNVYPREVEEAIDALPGVLESAVVGVPHPDLGEAVLAVVVPAPGAQVTEEELRAGLADRLARFKQPRAVVVVKALPRNTMGKVQKAELRRLHADAFSR